MLVDLRAKNLTGKEAEAILGSAHITCNKNGIPNDPQKPMVTSGIRLGSPAIIGSKVYQRITGGVDEVEYALRCWANVGADRPLIDAILPIRRRPGPAPA